MKRHNSTVSLSSQSVETCFQIKSSVQTFDLLPALTIDHVTKTYSGEL